MSYQVVLEAIFSKQKKGMRAAIPGFMNYDFRGCLNSSSQCYVFASVFPLKQQNTTQYSLLIIITDYVQMN